MQYAEYGENGPAVSRLGFGVMRLPQCKHGGYRLPHMRNSARLMRAAMAAGVNFFDSHHNYHGGKSEVAIGKALKGWQGHRIYIQTKTPWYREEPRRFFEQLLHEALEKLGVGCIDYLLHHSLHMETWQKRGKQFLRFTDWAMKRGLIRHRGFSSHDTPEHVKEYIDTGEFSCMLLSYNWLNPQMRDVIAYGAAKGMGVSVMNPVGGGTLAVTTPEILRLLPGAATGPETAMRYVLATPGVTLALSGMNTEAQLEENVAVASRASHLTAKQSTQMQARLARIDRQAQSFCTGCGYCMPCPNGVDIPANFKQYNQARYFGVWDDAKRFYNHLRKHAEGNRSAEACVRCGQCLPKCPNHVPIIEQLAEVQRTLA